MGIKVNKVTSADVGTGGGRLYTGVTALKVVGVNPNQAELKALGYNAEKTPTYMDDKNGVRIAFFLEAEAEGHKIKSNVAFFLKTKQVETLWLNKKGKFASDKDKIEQPSRNPYIGETNLYEFLTAWCDIKKGEDCYLESIHSLVKTGDVTELRSIFDGDGKDNEFKGLLYVREGKYQAVYSDKFEKIYSKSNEYLHKSLAKNWSELKGDFGPIDPKIYNETQFTLRPYAVEAGAAAQSGSAPSSQTAAGKTAGAASSMVADDQPF